MYQSKPLIFLCICALASAVPTHIKGVVEGFWWHAEDSFNGQFGQYTHAQRDILIDEMIHSNAVMHAKHPINVYAYIPHGEPDTTADLWSATEEIHWRATAKKALQGGITLVVGIRPKPGYVASDLTSKLDQLVRCGITNYILSWDDTGKDHLLQGAVQAKFVTAAVNRFKTHKCKLYGVVPAAYTGEKISNWDSALKPFDKMPANIPIILTARHSLNPDDATHLDFPKFEGSRRIIFWDNYMATDTKNRLPWRPPYQRSPKFFSDVNSGYLMNLAFPVERIIHAIYHIQYDGGFSDTTKSVAASHWADFLLAKQFIVKSELAVVKQSLLDGINKEPDIKKITALQRKLFFTEKKAGAKAIEGQTNEFVNQDESPVQSSALYWAIPVGILGTIAILGILGIIVRKFASGKNEDSDYKLYTNL